MRELEPSLQQFGEFLLKAHLVRPSAAPFVVRWVRRFMSRPATDEPVADQVSRFWMRSTRRSATVKSPSRARFPVTAEPPCEPPRE